MQKPALWGGGDSGSEPEQHRWAPRLPLLLRRPPGKCYHQEHERDKMSQGSFPGAQLLTSSQRQDKEMGERLETEGKGWREMEQE